MDLENEEGRSLLLSAVVRDSGSRTEKGHRCERKRLPEKEREIPEWKSQAKLAAEAVSSSLTAAGGMRMKIGEGGWGISWREGDRKNVDFWEGFPAGFPPFLGEERGTGQWVGPPGKNLSGGSKHDLIRQAVSPPPPLWQQSHYFSAGAL